MRWLHITSFTAFLATAACGGSASGVAGPSQPTVPVAAPSVTPTPAGRHIYGLVTDGDDGSPIASAAVSSLYSSFPPTATDGNGYFDLAAAVGTGSPPFNYLTITKPGYDPTYTSATGNRDERHDFHLYRPLNASAGNTTVVALSDDNSFCGLDDEFRCRAVYVAIPSTGTLVMDSSANDPTGSVWLVVGTIAYPYHSVTHLEIPVTTGSVVAAYLLRDWSAPPGIATLRTTLSN
jgi:hypothetical protein